jgi:hypothetical protein
MHRCILLSLATGCFVPFFLLALVCYSGEMERREEQKYTHFFQVYLLFCFFLFCKIVGSKDTDPVMEYGHIAVDYKLE